MSSTVGETARPEFPMRTRLKTMTMIAVTKEAKKENNGTESKVPPSDCGLFTSFIINFRMTSGLSAGHRRNRDVIKTRD